MISRLFLIDSQNNLVKSFKPFFISNTFKGKCKISPSEGKHNFSTCSQNQSKNHVSKNVRSSVPSSSLGEKAKEATKTTYYTAVIVVGLGALGLMMYAIFGELLSSFSPQSVYSAAVDKICSDARVLKLLGEKIKCHGETSRRGRRQHISHLAYEVEGRKGIRIKFYVQGQYRSATAHLDARMCSTGWNFRYLFIQSDSYPHDVVVIEDNRTSVDGDSVDDTSLQNTTMTFPLSSLKDM